LYPYALPGVVETVRHIAQSEQLTSAELQLLYTAALFHDAGFLETYNNHEEVSCTIARRYLPQFDYSDDEIEEICKLIMVTKLPQCPATTLKKIS
jgi:HD superfamily phosphodiesterase